MSLKEALLFFALRRELQKERWKPMLMKLKSIWHVIDGFRTHVFIAAFVLTEVAYLKGWISGPQHEVIAPLLGGSAGLAFSSKVNRLVGVIKKSSMTSPEKPK